MNKLLMVILVLALYACSEKDGAVAPVRLQCEYLTNPLGIDEKAPRLTWQMSDTRPGAAQKAVCLFVGTDAGEVASGKGNVWETGKLTNSGMRLVYAGKPLKPFTTYFWAVRIQDDRGKWSPISEVASFETGMMDIHNWKGDWITDTHDIHLKPAPYFRKKIDIEKNVRSARIYIAVAGYYELSLNGGKVGDHRLDPTYTRFDRRNLYVTYDVTDNLLKGENVIGVLLGNGWYNHQPTAVWYFDKAPWRARPKFCLEMHITYDDGTTELVSTGQDWKTALSPVIFNSIYTAEHYDARLEQDGWDRPGFDDEAWARARVTGAPSQKIVAQALHPVRNVVEIPAVSMTKLDNRTVMFDFGRNISGVTKITVEGAAGTVIRLKHAERLYPDGRADMSNIDVHYRPTDDSDPFQTDIFILSGRGQESFMPRFNYKGFQYVEVTSDKPVALTKESLTAYFMHSDVPAKGAVSSSNPVLDKIWQAANASYLSNLFGYPTDCPQREKNGWTGDAHIAIEMGLYNFDGITVYEKWLADHQDEQQPNGTLPAIIPSNGWGYHWANGPDWTSTIAIIPWNIYLFYGDTRLLESCYDNIRRYVDRITMTAPDGLTNWGLGDWVPVKSVTPKEFTSSIYYYVDAVILAKAAKLLGKADDFVKYSSLAEKIKSAINAKYLDTQTGIYGKGYQTELSVALKWGIVPEELVEKVARNLADRVIADNGHIDVGLLGTKAILNALSENGYADLAYTVASQETFPSWGWWIVNGATTLYENWPIDASRDISMNHIMFGEISAWYFKALGGIFPDEEQPGFKNIILKPQFVKGLEHFEAVHNGPQGRIVSSWKKDGEKVEYKVTVPPNSTARLLLPEGKVTEGTDGLLSNKMIKETASQGGKRVFDLRPGSYLFTITQNQ